MDLNGLQGFGTTREVADLDPLAEKFRAFGVPTEEIDGHDPDAIRAGACESRPERAPTSIVARTRKGCGVSFMEDRMEWHYLPLTRSPVSAGRPGDRAEHAKRLLPVPRRGRRAAPTSCS